MLCGIIANQAVQGKPLQDAEAMLLVDHAQAHAWHVHVVLNQSMSTDDELDFAFGDSLE
jgi:hypothetical protein